MSIGFNKWINSDGSSSDIKLWFEPFDKTGSKETLVKESDLPTIPNVASNNLQETLLVNVVESVKLSNSMDHSQIEFEKRSRRIRWILVGTDFTFALGAGMTVAYIPIFLTERYNFSPLALCVVTAGIPFAQGFWTKVADKCAKYIGAKWTLFIFHAVGTLCLFFFSFAIYIVPLDYFPSDKQYLAWVLMGGVAIFRSATLNCCAGISQNMLMAHVDDSNKTAFNSIECINTATWTGSAMLGGLLISLRDFETCFFITSSIYIFACAWTLFLPTK